MSVRRRDQLVAFQKNVPVENDHGDQKDNWTPIGEEWAEIHYGRGDERRQAAREQVIQAATFVVLANSMTRAVMPAGHRIVHGATAWDIVGPGIPNRKGEIEFDARLVS